MALNQNHVVQSSKTDYYYDHYSCAYTIRSEVKLSDCVIQELNAGKQAALKEYAQQRLNRAVQEINDVAQKLLTSNY